MRKIMIRAMALLLAAILVLSLVPAAMAAENINFGITVTEETDKITVKVADGNDEAFAELAQENKLFALTVPCGFEAAYVTFGGNVVESQLDTDEAMIRFPVTKSGEYQILKGEAPEEEPDPGEGEGSGGEPGEAEPEGGSGTSGSGSGSSGSGSGSSGTTTSSVKSANAAATTVPVQGDGTTVWVQASVSGSVASLERITTNQVKAAVGTTAKTGMLSVDLSALSKTVDSVKIPANVLQQIVEAAARVESDTEGLEIALPGGATVVFDGEALAKIASEAKNNPVTISVKDYKNVRNLTAAQKMEIGSRGAFDITVSVNGRTISGIGGRIKIGVPYKLMGGEKAEGLAVWYVDAAGNRELCETGYDSQKKMIFWWTDHLSLYVIDYAEPAAATEETTVPAETVPETQAAEVAQELTQEVEAAPERANTYLLWISGFCLLLALVLVGVLIYMRKKW